jgi:hypothetical protein
LSIISAPFENIPAKPIQQPMAEGEQYFHYISAAFQYKYIDNIRYMFSSNT